MQAPVAARLLDGRQVVVGELAEVCDSEARGRSGRWCRWRMFEISSSDSTTYKRSSLIWRTSLTLTPGDLRIACGIRASHKDLLRDNIKGNMNDINKDFLEFIINGLILTDYSQV
ncbi:hypothetical protein MUBE_12495 [Mycobacterium uberis]|uniref:Uncharacterized protein n=1 Tax=Mycobacterium uberis TaxID=2162698 RepID=A0A3E1HEF3_9MYCO|nr:hypothetical protein MUBE_12495 [Mycobacterium uberis]